MDTIFPISAAETSPHRTRDVPAVTLVRPLAAACTADNVPMGLEGGTRAHRATRPDSPVKRAIPRQTRTLLLLRTTRTLALLDDVLGHPLSQLPNGGCVASGKEPRLQVDAHNPSRPAHPHPVIAWYQKGFPLPYVFWNDSSPLQAPSLLQYHDAYQPPFAYPSILVGE
jgi:hypothetical protein